MSTLNPIFQNQKAQKVEVVNELKTKIDSSDNEPLNVIFPTSFLVSGGTGGSQGALRVSSNSGNWVIVRPSGTSLNLHISSVHVVNSGVGYIFPVDLWVYSLTSSAVANNVSAVYNSYSSRFQSATNIIIFYETYSSSGTVNAVSYSSTD